MEPSHQALPFQRGVKELLADLTVAQVGAHHSIGKGRNHHGPEQPEYSVERKKDKHSYAQGPQEGQRPSALARDSPMAMTTGVFNKDGHGPLGVSFP